MWWRGFPLPHSRVDVRERKAAPRLSTRACLPAFFMAFFATAAECVEVVYDAKAVPVADLLRLFWEIHDPTQLNRQGGDVGSQYRSTLFYTDDSQRDTFLHSLADTAT